MNEDFFPDAELKFVQEIHKNYREEIKPEVRKSRRECILREED